MPRLEARLPQDGRSSRGAPRALVRRQSAASRADMEPLEEERRADRAADERPRPEAARPLPGSRGHLDLGALAVVERCPEYARADRLPFLLDREFEGTARVEMPDLRGVDAMPAVLDAMGKEEVDGRACAAPAVRGGVPPGLSVEAALGVRREVEKSDDLLGGFRAGWQRDGSFLHGVHPILAARIPLNDFFLQEPMSQLAMTEPKTKEQRPSAHGAILVSGAGGEMGHALLAMLAARHHGTREIIALDLRALPADSAVHAAASYAGDVSDAAFIDDLALRHEVSEVWHLAALLSTRGEKSPELALKVNVMGSANLLKLAADSAARRGTSVKFMFPSTIAVYGVPTIEAKRAAGRVSEDQCLEPITMYGVNKRAVEEMGRYYARHYRLLAADRMDCAVDFRSIRFPGIISADTVPTGGTSDYGPEMLHAAAQGKPYACFVRPDARIPFMTMPDAVRSLMELAEAPREKLSRLVYNVSAFAPSAAEIAEKVREFFPKAEIGFAPTIERQKIVDSWPEDCDDGAARRDWGWKPEHGFHEAFAEYLVPRIRSRYGV